MHSSLKHSVNVARPRTLNQDRIARDELISSINKSVDAGVQKNDLHVYNPASMTWFNLSGHAIGTPPSARFAHGFTSAGDKLYVHGGYDGSGESAVREEGGNALQHLIFFLCAPAGPTTAARPLAHTHNALCWLDARTHARAACESAAAPWLRAKSGAIVGNLGRAAGCLLPVVPTYPTPHSHALIARRQPPHRPTPTPLQSSLAPPSAVEKPAKTR